MAINNLNDTIDLMTSSDYKDRFAAEYWQTKIRYTKLREMINKYKNGELNFTPKCTVEIFEEQCKYMAMYIGLLESRAEIEGIELGIFVP